MRALTTLGALALLTLSGLLMTAGVHVGDRLPFQVSILAILLTSLSTLFTPLSSAVGIPTPIPPHGQPVSLGVWPLLAWLATGLLVGLATRKPSQSIPPTLLAPAISYLGLIALSISVMPRIPGALPWEVYLSLLAQKIIIEGPLDFAFIFTAPTAAAVIASSIAQAATAKPPPTPPRRRRFWDWSEEEFE
jgi:hypothetical protein